MDWAWICLNLWKFEEKRLKNSRKRLKWQCQKPQPQLTNKQTKKLKTKEFEEILPTFCHSTKVKPWKFEKKKLPKLSFVWQEGGRKEEKKSLTNKQTKKVLKSKENSLTA